MIFSSSEYHTRVRVHEYNTRAPAHVHAPAHANDSHNSHFFFAVETAKRNKAFVATPLIRVCPSFSMEFDLSCSFITTCSFSQLPDSSSPQSSLSCYFSLFQHNHRPVIAKQMYQAAAEHLKVLQGNKHSVDVTHSQFYNNRTQA